MAIRDNVRLINLRDLNIKFPRLTMLKKYTYLDHAFMRRAALDPILTF